MTFEENVCRPSQILHGLAVMIRVALLSPTAMTTCAIRLFSVGSVYAIVDPDVFPFLQHLKWYHKKPHADQKKSTAYRITSTYPEPQKTLAMHQEVARFHGLPWLKITHHNGNGLDNRLENLVPQFCVAELDRRARAIREYQKIKAIRDYWTKNSND